MSKHLGSKLYKLETENEAIILFHCLGCDRSHPYRVRSSDPKRPVWSFNGDVEKPSFSPSLLVHGSAETPRCHLFVTDGQIRYCSDSEHDLAGQVVALPDWKEL